MDPSLAPIRADHPGVVTSLPERSTVRPLAPELPSAGTSPLATLTSARPALPTDADAWSDLATDVARASDRQVVLAVIERLAGALDLRDAVDPDAELIVLQRTFGALHRRAVAS